MTQVAVPPPTRPRRQRTLARDFLEVVIIAIVLYLVISLAFQTVRVDGFSMRPTLDTQDLLLATKLSYHLHDPERGDIIILKPADVPDANKDFIKRIIGLPGDVIEVDGNYVDSGQSGQNSATAILIKPGGAGPWQRIAETYLPEPWKQTNFCCTPDGHYVPENRPEPVTVPSGQYWVLGDNRNESRDSRFIGFVPRDNIVAEAWFRMFPFGHFGGLGAGPTLVPATPPTASSAERAPAAPAALLLLVPLPISLRRSLGRRTHSRKS